LEVNNPATGHILGPVPNGAKLRHVLDVSLPRRRGNIQEGELPL
jgi:hypothetical protein